MPVGLNHLNMNEAKYRLIVNDVLQGIASGKYVKGCWLPSVNEYRAKYNLSRDTIFIAYKVLKARGIIDSIPGKGVYVARDQFIEGRRIFLLFNELNDFKQDLYKSFMASLDERDSVDIFFYNYNRDVFEGMVENANGKYSDYVLLVGKMTGFLPLLESLVGRVFLLDHLPEDLRGRFSSVSQNFEDDTYEALNAHKDKILNYNKILLVQSEEKEPYERYLGLTRFAEENGLESRYLNSVENRTIKPGDLFMVANDRDMVDLLKKAAKGGLTLGKDFGIISFNDSPMKEILAGGITTLSTDFVKMGQIMASLLADKAVRTINNPWHLTLRSSI